MHVTGRQFVASSVFLSLQARVFHFTMLGSICKAALLQGPDALLPTRAGAVGGTAAELPCANCASPAAGGGGTQRDHTLLLHPRWRQASALHRLGHLQGCAWRPRSVRPSSR